ncbi:MAG: hypothetical protein IPL59_22085 [Candidatus Competibacteraceae bacterium]|uniref:Uncharacterized protein n=1 Tax=Candidatus Contendobacter odensis Run_B_J11 TaxID=1400861 RepID=A0A7U7GF33_9GAMM|nr:hypothetical protein [Candidatus Contendobacter odensis]MBK8537550.1 hypothetical protein [Candidatus Competibacteraceae bacterium]MBK8751458.1 hypothetical protein [Candidatus Competibacteraceae bacterium]CDH46726.1 membrane hypothetical protein [Candidatus Contendobacter odensis Run_B_J11]
MTDTPSIPLHPSLQRLSATHRRLLRLFGLLLAMTMAGLLLFLMVTAFSSRDIASLLLLAFMGLVMLPVMALSGGLLWYLDRWQERRLTKANQVLQDYQPVTVRIAPIGSSGGRAALVALHPLTSGQATLEPLHALLNPSFRWIRPPREEITVELYCPKLAPGHDLVALQSDGSALIGKVVALAAYDREQLLIKIVVFVLLALIATVLGVQALNQ